jgi:biopolymer transport protein ExbB
MKQTPRFSANRRGGFMKDYRMLGRMALWVAAVVMIFILPSLMPNALADEPGKPAGVAEADPASVKVTEPKAEDDSIMRMVLNSGATGISFLVVLILFSLAAVTVSLERAFSTRRDRLIPVGFINDLQTLTARKDSQPKDFVELCEKSPSPIANILKAGLLRQGRPVPEIEKAMEDAASREMAEIRGGIKPLNVIGNIAPLVGLLGTVLGMIIAFRTASQEGLGRGELMAQGIYMALLTTAAGLSIAIPCLLLAARYSSQVEKHFRKIDLALMETMPCFARMEQQS